MKRFLFAMALALACDAVAARRQLLDDTDEFVAYVETDTIERSSRTANMWILYDYKFKHTYLKWAYWSQRTLGEFDCKERRSQTLYYAFHEGQMGGGETIISGNVLPGLWGPVNSGSVIEKLWKLACGV
jgi:hypothetical protein